MLRIGITMRSSAATQYPEARDALARDWHRFMAQALPEVAWLPVPNLGQAVARWIGNWALDGVILSGGEDRGEDPLRDETEDALWALCQAGPLRLLGICRGLQQLWHWHGGLMVPVDGHVATRHGLRWSAPWSAQTGIVREVNSFHRWALSGPAPAGLQPMAWGPGGEVEAACAPGWQHAGLMWHPERSATPDPEDIRFMRWFWLNEVPAP